MVPKFHPISSHNHKLNFAKYVIHCAALQTESLFSFDFLRILIFPPLTLGLMLYSWLVVRSALRETPVLPIYVDDDTKIEKAGGKYIRM